MILAVPPALVQHCPWCGSDQDGGPVPGREGARYRRTMTVKIPGVYDGGLYWQCPDCGWRWHRWPEGDFRRARADRYIAWQAEPAVPRQQQPSTQSPAGQEGSQ